MMVQIKHDLFRYEHLLTSMKNLDEIKAFNVAELIGVQALYIYALPEDELIEHYSTFGFSRLEPELEEFVHKHVKPAYDESCIFMYQIL